MTEHSILYHARPGIQNTAATLEAAAKRAAERSIGQLVVATTTGQTALDCAEVMPDMDPLVAVMMHKVHEDVFVQRPGGKVRAPDPERVARAREKGVKIYRGVHSLMGGLGQAIQKEQGGWTPETLIARTYMTISTGTKVAVESVLMAADAGYLRMDREVLALGGWRGGTDTAVIIKPAFTHTFFDLRIREFIAIPRGDEGASQ